METYGYTLPWHPNKENKNDKFKLIAEKSVGFWAILFFVTIFLVKVFGNFFLYSLSDNIRSVVFLFNFLIVFFGPIILFLHLVVKNKRKIYYFLPLCFISAIEVNKLIVYSLKMNVNGAFFLKCIFILFFVIIFIYYSKKYWIVTIKKFFKNPKLLIYVIVIFFGLLYFLDWLIPAPDGGTSEGSNQAIIENTLSQSSLFFYWIFSATIIITGPIYEEIIYRFLVVQMFGSKKIWLAFIFSSLLFVFAHVTTTDMKDFFAADWSGKEDILLKLLRYLYPAMLFFGVFYITKFSLMYPILMHIIINFLAIWTLAKV